MKVQSSFAFAVVLIGGIGLTGSHFAPLCNLHLEFCQPDRAALPDEAPERLPRGPAPPPVQVLKAAASTSSANGTMEFFPSR
jgi:hypothetical protein